LETQEKLKEAFARYLENSYTAEDFQLIQDHFQQETEREALYSLIADELNGTSANDVKRIDQILDNTDVYISTELRKRKATRNVPLYRTMYFRIITAAVLIMGIGYMFVLRRPAQAQQLTVQVPYGKTMRLTLPDSSKVYLNAGTTLQYPDKFIGQNRTIKLVNGQAYFDVKHRVHDPFIVQADGVKVTVLGTAFEIKSFASEKEINVTVGYGKVGVLPNIKAESATILLPNEQAVIDKFSHNLSKRKIAPTDIAAWRQNKLVFQDENFQNIINALERKYNVQILVSNPKLLQQTVTMRIDNQPLPNVLEIMGYSNNFKYTVQNSQLIVIR